jgi:phosphoglycolate phosphatase
MIKYLIFDFDGTLVDSLDVIIKGYNQLAGKYKANKIKSEDISYLKELSVAEKCNFLNFKLYKFPLLALDVYKLYKHFLDEVTMFDGIKELLEQLKAFGYRLAIISTNSEHIIREFLISNKIDLIDDIICSNNLFGKDKDIKRFLKKHKLKNSEVIYVGDEVRDIIACKKNGVKVIWVSWGYDLFNNVRKEQPDYIINKPQEILSYIE